jgi:hypothetical protein
MEAMKSTHIEPGAGNLAVNPMGSLSLSLSLYDPVFMEDSDRYLDEFKEMLRRNEEAYGTMGYDEKTKTLYVIKKGNVKLALKLEQEIRDKRAEQPKSFEEYQEKEIANQYNGRKVNILDKGLTKQEYEKEQRDIFQDRYYLTDEFRKTDKFEELYNEYIDKKNTRDRQIANEVSDSSYMLQAQHVNDTLGESNKLKDSIIVSGKSKQEWIEYFDFMKDGFKTMLSEAEAMQKGDLVREDGTQRGDARGGFASPEKVIPEIENNIKFLDTLMNTLKDKWKYGSFDVAS